MFKKITKEELISIIIFCMSFLLFTLYNLSANELTYDRMWTFHMTQKIALGELPYKEINIIITPLFYQLGAVLFNVTGQANFAMYSVYGGIIGAFLTLLCYKVIKELTSKRMLSVFATLILTNITGILGETNYNTLLLALILTIVLLEMRKEKFENKNKYNIFIGIVTGLCAATKHTVGGITILATLILPIIKKMYLKEEGGLKEITNKLVGIMLIGMPYFCWLVGAGVFKDFIDLAILGMFDFAEKNNSGSFFNLLSLLGVAGVFAAILLVHEFKKQGIIEKKWLVIALYAMACLTYGIPLFNFYHILISCFVTMMIIMALIIKFIGEKPRIAFLAILITLVLIRILIKSSVLETDEVAEVGRWDTLNAVHYWMFWVFMIYMAIFSFLKRYKIALTGAFIIMFVIPISTNMYMWRCNLKENNKYYIPEYSCIGVPDDEMKDIMEVNEYILKKEAEGYNVRILDIIASKYMIPLHRNNYKFDLMLNGNLGYNGEEILIKEISEIENILILRQKQEVEEIEMQQPEEIDQFIEQNYIKIGEINDLEIYN